MVRFGLKPSEYSPLIGDDDEKAKSESSSKYKYKWAKLLSKHGRKLWWTIVGIALVIGLALVIRAHISSGSSAPTPAGEMTKDVAAIYKLTWPVNDMEGSTLMQETSPNGINLLKASSPETHASDAIVQEALSSAAAAQTSRIQTEQTMLAKGHVAPRSSPSGKHNSFMTTSTKSLKLAEDGFAMDQASKYVSKRLNLTKEQAARGIKRKDDKSNSKPTNPFDPAPVMPCIPPLNVSMCELLGSAGNTYHSSDGVCNNIKNPGWGTSHQPYRRILLPDYADGISSPRVASDGTPLPHPRKISTVILSDRGTEDSRASLLLPIFGQFIDHDITKTVPGPGVNSRVLSCCHEEKISDPLHPECYPFAVTENDELYSQGGIKCTSVWRSARYPSCSFGPRNQFSATTAYIDGSVLYGDKDDTMTKFREVNLDTPHGYMTSFKTEDGRKLLPVSVDLLDGCNIPEETGKGRFCFTAGDHRVNEQMALTSMHLLWSRQHNRIADQLVALNPAGHDGKVYFETREIIIAQIQHVTYNEFLPVLLGKELSDAAGLTLLSNDSYYTEYDDTVDASIANVFASAAYRMGHSIMQGTVRMMDAKRNTMEEVPLSELIFNPFRLWKPDGLDSIVRGLTSSPAGQADTSITNELTRHLFENRNGSTLGLDLAAINIQRGRDHGIPSYVQWRQVCGLDPVKDFSELNGLWNEAPLFLAQNIYKTVEDVDLYVGMLSEKKVPGAMVGPTLACLLTDQFLRLKKGDRFWYEGNSRARPFTPEQLKMIRKTTLARIICDNGDNILEIQTRVLEQPSLLNPIIPCNSASIPNLNYREWETNVNS